MRFLAQSIISGILRANPADSLHLNYLETSVQISGIPFGTTDWCSKGHVVFCIDGELHTELADGRKFTLKPGMSYQVADNAEPHRSYTAVGARLFIVD